VFGWAPLRSRQSAENKKKKKKKTEKKKNRKIIGSFTAEIFLVFVFFTTKKKTWLLPHLSRLFNLSIAD
jgi:cell division protein FtsB